MQPTIALRPRAFRWSALAMMATLLLATACGGGGGGGEEPPPPIPAPENLSYTALSVTYRTDAAITPNDPTWSGGDPTTWAVAPALPTGIALGADGSISGMPTAPAPMTNYTVTASNGSGQTQATVGMEILWEESKSLLPKANVTDAELRHFLDRTHFGFDQTKYDELVQDGLASYVDTMTTFADTTQLEADARANYLVDLEDPNGLKPSSNDVASWWIYMMLINQNPFQENLAFHWHEHFAAATSVLNDNNRHYFVNHVNLWRRGGAGDLRKMLIDMARDPAMLVWLDGINSVDGQPNENFGREFLELFCLGVDIEYTQTDIQEAARAFTGYRQRFDSDTGTNFIEFDPARHDHTEKTVLGVTIPAQAPGAGEVDEYDQMVDIVLGTNEAGTGVSRVGQWIVRSLLQYFCYANPPQNVIDELANDLRAAGWQLKPVLMKLLQSEAFFSAKGKEGFVKGPAEQFIGFQRSTRLYVDPRGIDRILDPMGHRPTEPPTVDGWPGGTQWLSAQGMVDRANMINFSTEVFEGVQVNLGITAVQLLPATDADAAATVDALALRLNTQLSPTERTGLITYMDTFRNGDGSVTNDPFDPVGNPNEAEDRVRGLLWILAQHPTYQTR